MLACVCVRVSSLQSFHHRLSSFPLRSPHSNIRGTCCSHKHIPRHDPRRSVYSYSHPQEAEAWHHLIISSQPIVRPGGETEEEEEAKIKKKKCKRDMRKWGEVKCKKRWDVIECDERVFLGIKAAAVNHQTYLIGHLLKAERESKATPAVGVTVTHKQQTVLLLSHTHTLTHTRATTRCLLLVYEM